MSFFNWAKIIGAVAALALAGWLYLYVTDLQKDLALSKSELQTKTLALQTAENSNKTLLDTVNQYQDAQSKYEQAVTELVESWEANTAEQERLRRMFIDHDLGGLANEKPGLIEHRINAGTARSIRLLNDAGANSNAGGTSQASGD